MSDYCSVCHESGGAHQSDCDCRLCAKTPEAKADCEHECVCEDEP